MKTNPFLLFRFSLFSPTFKNHPNSQPCCSSLVVSLPVSLSSFPHSCPSSQNHDGPLAVHRFHAPFMWLTAGRRCSSRSSSPPLTGARCSFFLLATVQNAASQPPPCAASRRRQSGSLLSSSPPSTTMCSSSLLFAATWILPFDLFCCFSYSLIGLSSVNSLWSYPFMVLFLGYALCALFIKLCNVSIFWVQLCNVSMWLTNCKHLLCSSW